MRRWLIKLRKEQQLTQQQIAKGAHIDRAYYAQIENGTRNPSMAVASRIASYLHINPSLFFSDQLSEPFETALIHSPVTIAHCDLDHRYTWLFNPNPNFPMAQVIGKRADEILPAPDAEKLLRLKTKVLTLEKSERALLIFTFSSRPLTYDLFCKPIHNSKGQVAGTATVSLELQR